MMQKIGGLVFALSVGLALAWFAYQSKPTPEQRAARQVEEAMVMRAREAVRRDLSAGGEAVQIVDPLNTNRAAGKSYVYPVEDGYEVSGYFRRGPGEFWMPWIVRLDGDGKLVELRFVGPDD